jgi:hypothetical protein
LELPFGRGAQDTSIDTARAGHGGLMNETANHERRTQMRSKRRLRVELLESRLVPSTFYLHQGDSLQHAIDIAQPGDSIMLDRGATFTGPITLDAKANPNNKWISIETNNFPLNYSIRVNPGEAPWMAKIVTPGLGQAAIRTESGANYYYLRALEILPVSAQAFVYTLVTLGDGSSNQRSSSQQPSNIELDQCYIHGWNGQEIKRGVDLNDGGTGHNGVANSYISNFKSTAQDSQAIAGWNGTGPYFITNNYLESAGENVMFGGAWSYIQKVPSNITITDNTFSKQLSWNPNDPSYAGTNWSVKNLLELKNAQNVTVENNTFQNNWVRSQSGSAIVITPRGNQDGGSWATVSNVTIAHNTITNSAQGILILGSDDSSVSQVTTNITIQNNLFGDVASYNPEWGNPGGPPRVFLLEPGLEGGPANIIIDHNTILQNAGDLICFGGEVTGFQFTNNIAGEGEYGVIGNGALGKAALDTFCPGYIFSNNLIVGGGAEIYPSGTAEPGTWSAVGFINYQANDTGDYLLVSSSPYHGMGSNIAGFSTALF